MVCVTSLTQVFWAMAALAITLSSVVVARIPFCNPMRRVAAMGTFLGMLLVRSFERTQRFFDAMLAHGYTGKHGRTILHFG
jgi:energy-coupling factor transporter transmembrane protein EcfT